MSVGAAEDQLFKADVMRLKEDVRALVERKVQEMARIHRVVPTAVDVEIATVRWPGEDARFPIRVKVKFDL